MYGKYGPGGGGDDRNRSPPRGNDRRNDDRRNDDRRNDDRRNDDRRNDDRRNDDRRNDDRRNDDRRIDDRRNDDRRNDDRRNDRRDRSPPPRGDRYGGNDRRDDDRRNDDRRNDDRRNDDRRNDDRRNDDRNRYGGNGNINRNDDRGGRYNNNDRGGNGGRGGFGGGRDSSGRGRGGRGGNPHMGTQPEIKQLLRSSEMSDDTIYSTLFPNNIDRSSYLENKSAMLPSLADSHWRYERKIGFMMPLLKSDNEPNIMSNHYRLSYRNLPEKIVQYDVCICIMMKSRDQEEYELDKEDITKKGDRELTSEIIKKVCSLNPAWERDSTGRFIGFTYDGRKNLFCTAKLNFQTDEEEFTCEVEMHERRFYVTIKFASEISPRNYIPKWTNVDTALLRALDSGLSSFARWMTAAEHKNWFLQGTKLFKMDPKNQFELDRAICAIRGYYASLKSCLAGTTLVMDISISAFLQGGPLMEIMLAVSKNRYRTVNEMYGEFKNRGVDNRLLDELTEQLKGAKVRITHLGHSKKFKGFGPKCTSKDTNFNYTDETTMEVKTVTVAEYFSIKHPGLIKFPEFPAVNIGSTKRVRYIPLELIEIVPGQSRERASQNAKLLAQLIKYASIKPNERARLLRDCCQERNGFMDMLQADKNSNAFGISKDTLDTTPMGVQAHILPNAKLQYGNKVLDPEFNGSWDLRGNYTFYKPGNNIRGGARVKVLICGDRMDQGAIGFFFNRFIGDASKMGLNLSIDGRNIDVHSERMLQDVFADLERSRPDIVFCVMNGDFNEWYRNIKQLADLRNLPSQCFKYPNVQQTKPGYNENVLLKVNTKLGGINHTLASRNPIDDSRKRVRDDPRDNTNGDEVFQQPPNSISWIFNEPCMLLGIDVNHPDHGSQHPSVAALVGSMDGSLSEYAAHVSIQERHQEAHNNLVNAAENMIQTFKRKNNKWPRRIIIFRDGVSEGQFPMLESEINAIKSGLELCGVLDCPIAMIVCQKRHNTRLFYRLDDSSYANICPGLCSDASGGPNSINSANYNEFYLNSHVSIQGTSKPCKYTITYDEIGLNLAEIETLTYWSSYLYCRCNKSVSVAAPAYYAHWAAKRGRILLSSGIRTSKLTEIFEKWNGKIDATSMFYV